MLFAGIPVFLLFLVHKATYTLKFIPIIIIICYLLLFLFSCYFLYIKPTYMLMLIPVICYLLLFLFSYYFLYVNPACMLKTVISVPAKQVRMLHDR
jgi:hypothetical protein